MSTAPNEGIRLDRDGPVARIVLDRPEQHNALRAVDVAALRRRLDALDGDPAIRALVVTAAGEQTFCAGASLTEMETGEMSGALFDTLTDRLAGLQLPTVCALNGSVYGGGAELALCCDFRVGSPALRLSVPAARLGVVYPVGGLGRYVRRLGLAAASRILLAGEELGGTELHRLGYLTHLVESPSAVATEATALARRLAGLAPLAVRGMKRIMLGLVAGDLDPAEAERVIAEAMASEDVREGLRAARERRDPDFKGR